VSTTTSAGESTTNGYSGSRLVSVETSAGTTTTYPDTTVNGYARTKSVVVNGIEMSH